MDKLTELLMYKALHFKQASRNDVVVELLLDHEENKTQTKQLCAKVSPQLATRLDEACNLLDISKRRFIEAAIISALDQADRVVASINIFDEPEESK
jgi:nucleoside 2-deoxyribosyltransferase